MKKKVLGFPNISTDNYLSIVLENWGLEKNFGCIRPIYGIVFLLQDFLNCYKYSLKWVDLFYQYPDMIKLNPVFFPEGK